MNHSEATKDPLNVRPLNHATAALYAYTPWVLPEEGGNWLVWSVANTFDVHAKMLGVLRYVPEAPLSAAWNKLPDGSYLLQTLADDEIESVRYRVDGIEIGRASRASDPFFGAIRFFKYQGPDRPFEVRGYNAKGDWVAFGNGTMDVGSEEAVYIQQSGTGEYLIGIERPREDTYAMAVSFNGEPLNDLDTGLHTSIRLRTHLALPVGERGEFEITVFNDSDQPIHGYKRSLLIR